MFESLGCQRTALVLQPCVRVPQTELYFSATESPRDSIKGGSWPCVAHTICMCFSRDCFYLHLHSRPYPFVTPRENDGRKLVHYIVRDGLTRVEQLPSDDPSPVRSAFSFAKSSKFASLSLNMTRCFQPQSSWDLLHVQQACHDALQCTFHMKLQPVFTSLAIQCFVFIGTHLMTSQRVSLDLLPSHCAGGRGVVLVHVRSVLLMVLCLTLSTPSTAWWRAVGPSMGKPRRSRPDAQLAHFPPWREALGYPLQSDAWAPRPSVVELVSKECTHSTSRISSRN